MKVTACPRWRSIAVAPGSLDRFGGQGCNEGSRPGVEALIAPVPAAKAASPVVCGPVFAPSQRQEGASRLSFPTPMR